MRPIVLKPGKEFFNLFCMLSIIMFAILGEMNSGRLMPVLENCVALSQVMFL